MPEPVRTLRTLVTVIAVGALLAGCDHPSIPPAQIRGEGYDCEFSSGEHSLTWRVTPTPGTVPDGFDPIEAVWCKPEPVPGGDDSDELTITELRSTRIAPLVARFATADAENDGVLCDMEWSLGLIPPRIWLLDTEGRAILGHSPHGVCSPNTIGLNEAFPQAN